MRAGRHDERPVRLVGQAEDERFGVSLADEMSGVALPRLLCVAAEYVAFATVGGLCAYNGERALGVIACGVEVLGGETVAARSIEQR